MKRHKYLVCYDIAHPKRLYRVAKVCESFGSRLQFSVFECTLSPLQVAKLRSAIDDVIDHDEDQVILVNLGVDSSQNPTTIQAIGLPYTKRARVTII